MVRQKTIARELIGISVMVCILVMQAMAIHPGDRIYIDAEGVVHNGDGFYEPLLVIERAMSNSHVKNIRQIQAGEKPARDKINPAYQ